MNKLIYLWPFFFLTQNLNAQTDQDFEHAGRSLFLQLTAPEQEEFIPMIRIKQYLLLLDNQEWDEVKKTKRKNQLNQSYSKLYVQWQESIELLQQNYREAKATGAELKYLETRVFPTGTLDDTYNMETSFIFKTENLQSEVVLSYEVAWLEGLGLKLMSEVREGF